MKILICDTYVRERGHYKSYIDCILRYYSKSIHEVYFLFNDFSGNLIPNLRSMKNVILLEEDLLQSMRKNSLFGKLRIAEFKLIAKNAEELNIDQLVMLDIDQFQVAISICKTKFKICGIYFRPYHRIKVISNDPLQLIKNSIRYLKKFSLEKILLINKNVSHLFLLNDELGVNKKGDRFRYLPDPIVNYEINKLLNIYKKFDLNQDVYTLLVFGGINYRKNVENLILSLSISDVLTNVVLLLIGPIETKYREN